jgi:hypothetical protein
MSLTPTALNTRSEKLFITALSLALEGNHRDSDEILGFAHELREQELRLADIAQHAPANLALLLVKAAMTGFSDDADPAAYIAENRNSIQFYAENDRQLHNLMNAIFHPTEYRKAQLSLKEDELEAAREVLIQCYEVDPARKAVSDKTITPAAIAVLARGFKEFASGAGGCSILRQCPACLNKYSTKVHFINRIYWHCPHCNTINEA